MLNNFETLNIKIQGASHADRITLFVDGLPKGKKIDLEELQKFVDRRKASLTAFSTKRIEGDIVHFASGIKDGVLTGETLEAYVLNENVKSKDYSSILDTPRPSHADYVAYVKWNGKEDMRGGGKFSGRLTVAICILGGIAKQLLREYGIEVEAYISSIGNIKASSYKDGIPSVEKIKALDSSFRVFDKKEEILSLIENVAKDQDSIGGKIECIAYNVKPGLADTLFDSLEGKISSAVFAVPAVKGVEFGAGFDIAQMRGSQANDEFYYDENKNVKTYTNNNGGINGGIANGMPITLSVAIKPTPSISKEQRTINVKTKENVKINIQGRHDACIVPRAVAPVESAVAIAILDSIISEA